MPETNNDTPESAKPSTSVPIEFVQTPLEKPEIEVVAADIQPQPEPHELLAEALGDQPQPKSSPSPISDEPEIASVTDVQTTGDDEPSSDALISVAELGDDDHEEDLAPVDAIAASASDDDDADDSRSPQSDESAESVAADSNPFEDMQLAPKVVQAIAAAGYEAPTPIQAETVPHLVQGRDMIGQAETGSGKTAAFAWPVLSRIDLNQHAPQVIVLAPTRELAMQVANNFKKYASSMPGFRVTTIYGGQSYETQFRALDRGAHVVVGTPGRVMDHLERGTLDLSQLKTFVLDEADEMLRMGFIDDIETILEKTPRTQQTVCFSATMPPQIKRIAERYLTDPVHIKIQSKSATADTINQTCVFLTVREKLDRLVRFLETEDTDGVLVFVKTRQSTVVVSEHLIHKGHIASALNGDINQQQRERTVSQLKNGKINVVVATDVAARGLDVQRISHVINYDFPHDTEAYVHRIGRTGRAGRIGNAVLFVEPKEKGKLSRLQRATNQKIETFREKSLEEINAIRIDRFKQKITANLENASVEFFQKIVSELQTDTELPLLQIAAALGVIAQGDQPLLLEALQSRQSNWKKNVGKGQRGDHGPMQTFRVEVGRRDNIGPGNLVGAITNEADLSNADIGRIRIHDRFSTIDLPANLPADLIAHLGGVSVGGRPLEISKSERTFDDDRGGRGGFRGRGGRRERSESRGRGDRNRGGRPGDRGGFRGRSDRRPEGRGGEQGFNRRGPREESGRDGRKGEFKREYRGGSDRGQRDGNRFNSQDRPSRERAEQSRGARGESRNFVQREGKEGKTKAAKRAKQKRRTDAKLSSPVKKYVKIRGKKK